MKAKAVWIAGLSGLALLSAYGVVHTLPNVESDLRAHVAKALADAGLDDVKADVSGQTVTLSVGDTVTNPDQHLKQAEAAVEAIKAGDNLPPVTSVKLVNNAPVLAAVTPPVAAPVPELETVQGEKATMIVASTERPAVAGDDAHDAAAVAAQSCQEQVTQVMGGRKLGFVFGTYDLTADSQPILDDVYKIVSTCPDNVQVVISGFTDNVGDANANRLISQARAQTTADGLVARGLASGRVKALGYGPAEPVADNDTPEGRAKNRRVVIDITAG